MSEFSYVLSRHVHGKNIKTYALAQYCGLDRSNMYKIINGKRKPTSLEMVNKMARFMHLSPAEEKELEEAYEITLTGYDNYYRRKDVLNFFSEFNLAATSLSSFSYKTEHMEDKEIYPLNSPSEVRQALFHIISEEMDSSREGHIRMLIQPDSSFLMNLLSAESRAETNIHIEHIICLNNDTETTSSMKNYNLHCLKHVLPLYGSYRDYECFYYYDSITARTGAPTLFPYMVITSRCACLLTSSLHKGYVTHSKESHRMFTDIFADYRQESSPLLKPVLNAAEQIQHVGHFMNGTKNGYSFQMTPCLTPFITQAHLEKYISRDMPGYEEFIDSLQEYLKYTSSLNSQGQITGIFSLAGVRRFWESGAIDEYPPEISPFEMHDRTYLIKKLIQTCNRGNYRMLRKSIGNVEHGLYLFVTSQNGYLMFSSPYTGQPVYLDIEEPGLLFTFYDFCENLAEDMFYTAEETSVLLNDLIIRK